MSKHFHDAKKITDPESDDIVEITESAYEGLEACRQSGAVNMLNFNGVQKWCFDNDYHATVVWMMGDDDMDKSFYGTAILSGIFKVVPDHPDEPEEVDLSGNEAFEGLPEETIEMMNENANEQERKLAEKRNTRILGRNHEELA